MIFRFLILSDEVDDFRREIQIDADSNFFDLHKAITKSVGYKDDEMASFFICSDDWEKEQEITLFEMNTNSEEDSYTMAECRLGDYLEDEKQKLMYVFDYITERAFFMELREIITGKDLDVAICSKSIGDAPSQFIDFETFDNSLASSTIGEDFYGDEGYNIDELDVDGFDGLDDIPSPDSNDNGY